MARLLRFTDLYNAYLDLSGLHLKTSNMMMLSSSATIFLPNCVVDISTEEKELKLGDSLLKNLLRLLENSKNLLPLTAESVKSCKREW